MKYTPWTLTNCFSKKKDFENDGNGEDNCTTEDGTVDVHGRPASKRTTGGWKGANFSLAQQMLSTWASVGLSANMVAYLTDVMHETNEAAAQNVSNWNGASYIFPLIGAFFADSYTGRFAGAVLFSVVNIVGSGMLTVSAGVHSFRPPQCPTRDFNCEKPSLAQSAFFFAGMYVSSLGWGGTASTVATLGADQFDEHDEAEVKKLNSYFSANLVAIVAGSLVAATFFVYVQDNVSAGLAWGLSTAVLVVGTIAFVFGRPYYRYNKVGGNALTRIAQVFVAFLRKISLKVSNPDDLYEIQDSEFVPKGTQRIQHSNRFRLLDKAAILTNGDNVNHSQVPNPWRVCTVTQVEEVKFILSVIPILLTTICFSMSWSQLYSLFIEEAYSLDCKIGSFTMPGASIVVIESLSIFFAAFFYDRLLVPYMRRQTGNPQGITSLVRMGIGLVISICGMIIAAVVDRERIRRARIHGLLDDPYTPIPMSVFYLVPQYFVIGASEIFTFVGLIEFFYNESPDALRCLAISLQFLISAAGFFLNTLLLSIVGHITRRHGKPGWIADNLNRARLDLFYWLLVVLSTISLLLYIVSAMFYQYKVSAPHSPVELASRDQSTAAPPVLHVHNSSEVMAHVSKPGKHLSTEPLTS